MLPDEQATPEQLAIFKAMTPEQRWHAARQLYWTVRKHKEAFLRSQHLDWTDEQLKKEVRDIFPPCKKLISFTSLQSRSPRPF